MRVLRRVGLAIVAIAALGVLPAAAQGQALSIYPEDPQSRTFGNNVGGWTQSTSVTGPCLAAPLLCPSVANSHEAAGGADGAADGYIDTEFTAVASALGATASGIWESPAFAYNGASGQTPQLLGLVLHRRADVGELIGLGHSATYTVEVIDVADPTKSHTVIDQESLAGAPDWMQIPPVAIPPAAMTIGRQYKIRITSTFNTGLATALIMGTADWDNVGIAAIVGGPGGGYTPFPPVGDDDDRGAGPGKSGVSGAAVLRNGKIFVNARCNRNVETRCKMKLTGLLKKRGPKVTQATRTSVKAGRKKRVGLTVKDAYLGQLESRKRIWVKQRVTANGKRRTAVKRLPLRG